MITLTQQPKPPGKGLALSTLLHIAAGILLVQFGGAILAPPAHRTGATLVFLPPPPPQTMEPAPLPRPKLRAFRLPKLPPPEPVQVARKPALLEAPAIQPAPAPAARPTIQVPQLAPAPPAVQTGVFSRNLPNEPERPARATAQPAGFDGGLPTKNVENEPKRTLIAQPAGFDNGGQRTNLPNEPRTHLSPVDSFGSTTTIARASARTGAVSDGGFGTASSGTAGPLHAVQQTARAGFGDTVAAKAQTPNPRPAVKQASVFTPVEITFKPRPAYTEEARRAQVEGEVLVQTVFTASGEVQIVRIIRGLPHGLNEMALAAVQAIRFRPALRHGEPIDTTATVRMNFELAY